MHKQLSVLAMVAALTLGVAGSASAANSTDTSGQNTTSENTGHGMPDTLGGSKSRMPDTLGGTTTRKGGSYGSSTRENTDSANGVRKLPDTLGGTNEGGDTTQHRH